MTLYKSTILLATCSSIALTALAAPEIKQTLYQESRTTITRDNQSQTVTRKVWIKHPGRLRMEETIGPATRISVSNGVDYWVAVPSQKKGIHHRLTPQQASLLAKQLNVDLDMLPKFMASGAKKVRREKVNGVLCDVYQRAKKEQLTLTLWIPVTGPRLAQKQEESGIIHAAAQMGEPMRTHILKSTTDYLKWQVDQPIADSEFAPPPGIKYQEIKAAPAPAAPKKR